MAKATNLPAGSAGTGLIPLYSNGVPERNISAAGTTTYDLAVNPLSFIMLNFRPVNSTGTLTNYKDAFDLVSAAVSNVQVLYRGEVIKSFNGADLMAFNFYRWGIWPWEANPDYTNADKRSIAIPLIFGKNAYDPESCFPATHRGELQLSITLTPSGTGYSSLNFAVDFCELLNANPIEFEKNITQNITYLATGQQDVDFSLGNPFRNILCWGTTGYNGSSPAPTLGTLKVLLGNVERNYTAIDAPTANVLSMLWGRQQPLVQHAHYVTATTALTSVTLSSGAQEGVNTALQQYAWLDFDPTKDDTYTLQTAGANRFHIRATVGTANAARYIPTEVISFVGGSEA